MAGNRNLILRPESIHFGKNGIRIKDSYQGEYRLPYKELVLAGVRVFEPESRRYYEPEVEEITETMEGELYFYDSQNCNWRIGTERLDRAAGALLSELSMHAPYILIGRQTWFHREDPEEFAEIRGMVELMRQCR